MKTDLFDLFSSARERVNADPHLQYLGRYCSAEVLLQSGRQSVHLAFDRGHLREVIRGPLMMRAWQFALRARPQAWRAFWQPFPAVGYNDIFAMSRHGYLVIDGDVAPLLAHLRFIKEVIALPRDLLNRTETVDPTGRTPA